MQKLKQTIVKRKSHTTDEETMGFHDYVEKERGLFRVRWKSNGCLRGG